MTQHQKRQGGLVYSTDHGRMCPGCRNAVEACTCASTAHVPSQTGCVRITRETKGRKGKGVTVITGLPLPAEQLAVLGKALKKLCGSGGTVKDGRIEIQGEQTDKIKTALLERGFKVK